MQLLLSESKNDLSDGFDTAIHYDEEVSNIYVGIEEDDLTEIADEIEATYQHLLAFVQ